MHQAVDSNSGGKLLELHERTVKYFSAIRMDSKSIRLTMLTTHLCLLVVSA